MTPTIRVAVCDDARAVKLFLAHMLEEEGDMQVVSSTSTGEAMLAEIAEARADVLLLDLVLPDVPEPAELVAELRERTPDMAILLISNMPDQRLATEAERLGVDGWLTKAHKPEDLRGAVRRLLGATP